MLALGLPPGVEMTPGHDVRRDALVVERHQRVLVDDDVAASGSLLQLLDLVQQGPVGVQEVVACLPVSLDQGVSDEQVARGCRIDAAQVDESAGDDRDAVQRHRLQRHSGGAVALPVRLGVRVLDQVTGQRLDPRGVDLGHLSAPEPRGLDQLAGHDPVGPRPGQAGSGEYGESRASRGEVVARLRLTQTDVRQQSGKQRLVDALGVVGAARHRHVEVAQDPAQLRHQVLPLADAQVVQELLAAHAPEPAGTEIALPLTQVAPQREVRQQVRRRVLEPGVRGVGLLSLVGRSLARVLDSERRRNHHHLAHTAEPVGLQHHPAEAGVQRQPRKPAPDLGEPGGWIGPGGGQRTELFEQLDTVAYGPLVRRVEEAEVRDLAETERGHLQDNGSEVGAQDLRVGEPGARVVVLARVEPHTDAVLRTAAATGALVGRCLRHSLDRQPLHLEPLAVAGDSCCAGVDDVPDAGHSQRGLGDVGRQHHPTGVVRGEHPMLLGGRQPAVQRDDLDRVAARPKAAGPVVRPVLAQRVRGVAYLPFAGQEHQHVAWPLGADLADGLAQRLHRVAIRVCGRVSGRRLGVDNGSVAHLDRVRPPGDLQHRCAAEVFGEPLRVDGRRADGHLQVGAPGEQGAQVPEQEVDVEAPLMGLVDDDGVVAQQQGVAPDLGYQDAVGHQLDEAVISDLVGEPHRVADLLADVGVHLFGQPFGHAARDDPPRLGVPAPGGRPRRPQPTSRSSFGSWVVLPEPVSPASTTTGLARIAPRISSRAWLIGSSCG